MPEEPKKEVVHKFCRATFAQWGDRQEILFFNLISGGENNVFVLTPDHAKQVAKMLQIRIDAYEREHGLLEGRLPSDPMKSPIDLSKPEDEGKV